MKYEILNAEDEDLAEDALAVLQAVAVRLGKGFNSTQQTTRLVRYLKPISKECNEHLKEPQHKQAKATGRILRSLAAASWTVMRLLVEAVVPSIFTLYQDADSLATRRALLEILVSLLNAAVALGRFEGTTENVAASDHPLVPFKEQFFELFSPALMSTAADEVSFQLVALEGLLRLCQIRNLLQNNEIGMIVQYFDEKVLSDEPDAQDDLRNQALQALAEISKSKPNLIMEITFPAFMARLPDSSHSSEIGYLFVLEGLARVSIEQSISETLVRRLLNKLDVVLQSGGSANYTQAILSTLDLLLCRRDLADDPNLSSYHEKIVVGLVKRAASVSSSLELSSALDQAATLEILGRLAARIIRALDEHKRLSIALQTYALFADEDTPFTPVLYTQNLPEKHRLTMILSTWLLASVGTTVSSSYILSIRHSQI